MGSQIADDQSDIFAFLADPTTHGLAPGSKVTRVDTHGAVVFLAGGDAYKVKRAIRFPFMDFSTLEKRRQACENEIEVNRDNAPALYFDVVPLRRGPQGLRLGGQDGEDGEIVEWAVHLRRFDETATLDLLADRGVLDCGVIAELAGIVIAAHERAPPRDHDATRVFRRRLGETLDGLAAAGDIFSAAEVAGLRQRFAAAFAAVEPLLIARQAQGKVRRCHGDLHLRNIVLFEGHPVLFDAIEFDESIATCDILYDLAFLVMDLWQRGLAAHANLLFNRYIWGCKSPAEELAGLAALPVFLALRAAIRGRVTANLLKLQTERRADLASDARRLFDAARAFLAPGSAQLVIIGGLSGSGKSTLARHLAAGIGRAPGALHLRSDIERKRAFGVGEFDRLPDAAYEPAVSVDVYERLCHFAGLALQAGQSVIVDAVHAKAEERAAIAAVAQHAGVKFTGLWLEAPRETLTCRVEMRRDDASDADVGTVGLQATLPIGKIDWTPLDAGMTPERLAQAAGAIIGTGER
jgi:uncharacterized protein